MSGINHIVGGTVFTALFSSFWSINIFAKASDLLLCITFSILPDIDYTKSPIGRICYPLSRYLERNFGHRTITHSLITFIPLLVVSSIVEKYTSPNNHLSIIIGFSYSSHLIFDMMTKEGIPLFYPLDKTPCVIPANPDLRLRSGNFKTECIIFLLFSCIAITCQPLFKQGFWSTINKSFGTIKNLYYEFLASPNQLLNVTYHFYTAGESHQGTAYLIHATPQKAILFNQSNQKFMEITNQCPIKKLSPSQTPIPYQTEEIYFHDIPLDSLFSIITNKPLLSLQLTSNIPIQHTNQKGEIINSNQLNISYTYNPVITANLEQEKEIQYQLKLLNHQLETLLAEKKSLEHKQLSIKHAIQSIENHISKANNYSRQKLTNHINQLRKELEKSNLLETERKYDRKIQYILIQLEQIKKTPIPRYQGHIKYLKGL